jgi:hypothetical protein
MNGVKRTGWDYIFSMEKINRLLETEFAGTIQYIPLYSPLPLNTSMTPGFIRINTSGLMDLMLSNQDDVKKFAAECSLITQFDISETMKNKKDVNLGLEKLLGRDVTEEQKIQFMRFKWTYFFNFELRKYKDVLETNRHGVVWGFDHAILTDGYTVNFQVSPQYNQTKSMLKRALERKKAAEKKKLVKQKRTEARVSKTRDFSTEEFPHCDDPSLKHDPTTKSLGGDPGKQDLLAVSDGIRTIRLTSNAMNFATKSKARGKHRDKLRRRAPCAGSSVSAYESEVLSQASHKSCVPATFRRHLQLRFPYEGGAWKVYSRPLFRQSKFLVYCAKKSVVQKFINRIKSTFSKPVKTSRHEWMKHSTRPEVDDIKRNARLATSKLVIMYGDWGRNPNLRNSAPTPGIGLRRLIHKHIPTTTTDERGSSQTCPCCMSYKQLINPIVPVQHKNGDYRFKEKHSLRLCTKEGCMCSRWNRNVSAAYVILERALKTLISHS